MRLLLSCLAVLSGAPSYAQSANTDAALKQAVSDSTACLSREVNQKVAANKISITVDERSSVRIGAVTACHVHDETLAKFSDAYISETKSLMEVTEEMTVTSLKVADAMIMTRVKTNAEKAK